MAKSYKERLDGHLEEFIHIGQTYSIWEAMEKFNLKDYVRAREIGIEATGDENFGLNRTASSYINQGIRGLLREFVVAFADYVIRKERENQQLKKQLGVHSIEDKKVERQFADEITGLMETLKSSVPESQIKNRR